MVAGKLVRGPGLDRGVQRTVAFAVWSVRVDAW